MGLDIPNFLFLPGFQKEIVCIFTLYRQFPLSHLSHSLQFTSHYLSLPSKIMQLLTESYWSFHYYYSILLQKSPSVSVLAQYFRV